MEGTQWRMYTTMMGKEMEAININEATKIDKGRGPYVTKESQ